MARFKEPKKIDKKTRVKVILILILITTVIVSLFSLSKYASTSALETADAEVAKIIVSLDGSYVIDVPISPMSPNNEQNFEFSVTNTNDDDTSEVTVEYTIEIETGTNLPLEFELYDSEENQIELESNVTKDKFTLALSGETDEYTLKIIWDENYTSYEYSNCIDYVKIIINSTQVD